MQPGRCVLDLGCGEGSFTGELARVGAEPVGVDVAEAAVTRARRAHPALHFSTLTADGRLPLEDSSCDLVWAGEVIEHVADTARTLSEIRRVLRPGGRLLITTPNNGRLRMLTVLLLRFEHHFDPLGGHLRFFTRRSLRSLLEQFGFERIQIDKACGLPGLRTTLLCSALKTSVIASDPA